MRSYLLILALGAGLVGFNLPAPNTAIPDAGAPASVAAAPITPAAAAVSAPSARAAFVASALEQLSARVVEQSHSDALKLAFQAYFSFRAAHPEEVRKPYLYFVDYGLDNRTPRGYVFNMDDLTLVDGPFIVAHGRGSSAGKNGVPMRFSNASGSASTSLGLYVAGETYGFSGKSGGQHYTSIGLRMDGVSGRYNSQARARGVVVHGAPYVSASGAGRSEGCPAMEQFRARRLIPLIANGGVVFLFSPNHENWLQDDPWANAADAQ